MIEETPKRIVLKQKNYSVKVEKIEPAKINIEDIESIPLKVDDPTPVTLVTLKQGPPGGKGDKGDRGFQGEQGIQGIPGTSINGTAGESISVYSVVVLIDDLFYKADPTNMNHVGKVIGVATQSANLNDSIVIAQVGLISGGSFTAGTKYYVGLNGILSTSVQAVGGVWSQFIGIGKSISELIVNLEEPYAF